MGLNLVQARLDQAKAEMAVLESEKDRLTLTAPVSGLVGVFHKTTGDHITPHEPLVQLLDEEQPYLLLQFPSERIADFAPGSVLDLKFPSGHRGKGRVEQIPPQASGLPGESGANPEMVIAAHVERVGALWPSLPFGSKVEVLRRR
jgi:multidrug resistance efflux pump